MRVSRLRLVGIAVVVATLVILAVLLRGLPRHVIVTQGNRPPGSDWPCYILGSEAPTAPTNDCVISTPPAAGSQP